MHQRPRGGDAVEYLREHDSILEAIEHGPRPGRVHLEVAEMGSHRDLFRALSRHPYDLSILSGQGPDLGLRDGATTRGRLRSAPVLAEQFAANCRPGAAILLLGCCTSWLAPSFAARGLRAVGFDGHLPGAALLAFLAGYIDSMCAGRSFRHAFEDGCRAMAFEYFDALEQVRSFGADAPPDGRYVWIHAPVSSTYESDL